uniref:AlNc14C109G6325 protein n=1 Tax=Albugo laibachii Nc14 TaxID=890382 RepID=F0WIC4_9STRA|nr:AlNc14C109G6325 [Albugo laibachii Nc14]|eukprot:CCA21005.1 AlNc14C109G6325 [Albugo laibachii Nc14]
MGRLRSKRKLKKCDPFFEGKRKAVGKQQKQYDLAPKDIKKKKKKLTNITREKPGNNTHQSSEKKKTTSTKSDQLTKIHKDESMRDYSKRINQQVKRVIYEETKKGRRKTQKAKIYFEKKKDKQKHKKNQQGYELPTDHAKEMFEGAEFIPFGERVDEPPKLPNPCKKRKQLH